ncbi:MAG TPA: hypothetical protein VEQ63_16345, partial [Bryobacteraceae bacterium]|nr:hypothetical protein [Bryobacteraceae bacterium]
QISSTHPQLRQAANLCLANGAKKFQDVLDGALGDAPTRVDTASLASLWMATFQGSLTLARASEDPSVIRRNFNHVKTYIASLLPAEEPRK